MAVIVGILALGIVGSVASSRRGKHRPTT
jgi:hypothetical protein